MICPLCSSNNIVIIESINSSDVNHLYNKKFKIDTSKFLRGIIKLAICKECSLHFYSPTITGDESFYNQLQKYDWYYSDNKNEFNFARKFINENSNVLEVGSGKGAFSKLIPTVNYTGLDFSENAKILAQREGIKIQNIPIEEFAESHREQFDIVCSFQVLEHVSNPKEFIESKIMCLKPNGRLILSVPAENSFLQYVSNDILNMPPHHVTLWEDTTLEKISELYNLEMIDIHHEKVQNIHKCYYIQTQLLHFLNPQRGKIDSSYRYMIFEKILSYIAFIFKPFLSQSYYSNGHTVVAVYKKRG